MLLEFVALIALIHSTFGLDRGQATAPPRAGVVQARPGKRPLSGFPLNRPLPQPRTMPRGPGGPGMEMMRTRNVFERTKKNWKKRTQS
ncbi:unnamed protein product [Cylicocyclus nassatus]|uniref:Secreted protein n=1 Tax=Cylicocyclus nassatus TaxID=53992 RepID=A0AA36GHF7_CYLNA|nr:unnamed protein product [Cylicocyclus nassatus]